MEEPETNLRRRLRHGEPLLGLIMKMPAARTIEIAASRGFDVALIDAEHGNDDMREIEDHVRAAEAGGISSLVRVGDATGPEVLRALDAGADGIVAPHISSATAVAAAADAVSYPPEGRRGIALSTRAARYGGSSLAEHIALSEDRVALVAQIEDAEALPELDAIFAEPRLDAVFLGPADLSTSLGRPGDFEHPAVTAAFDSVLAAARRSGLSCFVFAGDLEEGLLWRRRGAQAIFFGAPGMFAAKLAEVVGAMSDPDGSR